MPIYVTVYHLDKMIVGKTEGDITLADIEGYLDDIVKARAVPYRKRPMRVFADIHAARQWLDEKLPIS